MSTAKYERACAVIEFTAAKCNNDVAETAACLMRAIRELVFDGAQQMATKGRLDVPAHVHAGRTLQMLGRTMIEEGKEIVAGPPLGGGVPS